MWAGLDYNGTAENNSGYLNNMDEAFILQGADLTGADAAFLDVSILCSVAFTNLFLAEPYVVQESGSTRTPVESRHSQRAVDGRAFGSRGGMTSIDTSTSYN